tara:strand:- start:566 stop:889 length:324 start_codon:yes stop_codon:yes gene_type:complete
MIFSLIIIALVLLILILFVRKYELFNIRLEKATSFYNDYRNFLDGNDYLLTKNRKDKRLLPYKINTKCFDQNYRSCKEKNKCGNSKVVDKLCEEDSFNSCVINSFIY